MKKEIDLFKNKTKELLGWRLRGGPRGGVHVLSGHLRCDFNDPGLVYDSGRAVALFHDPNNPCLVAFPVLGRLDLCAEPGSLLSR